MSSGGEESVSYGVVIRSTGGAWKGGMKKERKLEESKERKEKKERKRERKREKKGNKSKKRRSKDSQLAVLQPPSPPQSPQSLVPFVNPVRPHEATASVVPFRGVKPEAKSDMTVLAENYRFDTDSSSSDSDCDSSSEHNEHNATKKTPQQSTWQSRLASSYSSTLHKETAIISFAPLLSTLSSPAPVHTVGLRWRTKDEVLDGFGFGSCGNRGCPARKAEQGFPDLPPDLVPGVGLTSFEFPFLHTQQSLPKLTYVTVRLCDSCSVLGYIAGKKLAGSTAVAGAVEMVREERGRLRERNEGEGRRREGRERWGVGGEGGGRVKKEEEGEEEGRDGFVIDRKPG